MNETASPVQEAPPDLTELYYECGRAVEKAQVMELAAGNFALAYVTLFVDVNNVTPEVTEWVRHLMEDVNSKTFGTLVKKIKKSGQLDDSLIAIVDEALKKRNYFTHHFSDTTILLSTANKGDGKCWLTSSNVRRNSSSPEPLWKAWPIASTSLPDARPRSRQRKPRDS